MYKRQQHSSQAEARKSKIKKARHTIVICKRINSKKKFVVSIPLRKYYIYTLDSHAKFLLCKECKYLSSLLLLLFIPCQQRKNFNKSSDAVCRFLFLSWRCILFFFFFFPSYCFRTRVSFSQTSCISSPMTGPTSKIILYGRETFLFFFFKKKFLSFFVGARRIPYITLLVLSIHIFFFFFANPCMPRSFFFIFYFFTFRSHYKKKLNLFIGSLKKHRFHFFFFFLSSFIFSLLRTLKNRKDPFFYLNSGKKSCTQGLSFRLTKTCQHILRILEL